MDVDISFALPRQASSVTVMRSWLANALNTAGLDDERIFRLLTAASEACANAVEHGDPAREFQVRVQTDADHCRISVSHRGRGFVPRPRPPAPGAESGRGLLLMDGLVSDVRVSTPPPGRQGRTTVLLTEDLEPGGTPGGRDAPAPRLPVTS
ncbi:ATP-binding protein [Nocardiopsis sp. RSe5-2]|uniref:ATP-binding protein n=1 Tax=Nocardiopsis endophytica TaxID=3018445 RepID=A0ABT4UBH8_9ACTN|nr:ATP-binding protein [Nocardiopsis endophytica]MDA2814321.1 ATP-binding protein [Nocardiopsis endophytica]